MSTHMQELEKLKSFKYMVLLTLDNSPNIGLILLLNNITDSNSSLQIETFARNAWDSARVLAVIKGNVIEMNRKKFYYGENLVDQEEFMDRVVNNYFNPGSPNSIRDCNELRNEMKSFFKSLDK